MSSLLHFAARHEPLIIGLFCGKWALYYISQRGVLKSSRQALYITNTFVCDFWHGRIHSTMHSTGWRRLIRCLKSQVIFRKRANNYRAFLRKMTYENKAFYDSTPPCTCIAVEQPCILQPCIECIAVYWMYCCSNTLGVHMRASPTLDLSLQHIFKSQLTIATQNVPFWFNVLLYHA